jgi:serine/threonine-protein kinase
MGSVYLAEDLRLPGKRWAVKETWHAADVRGMFLEEARMLVKLQHPRLPQIADYYPPNVEGYSYLVMEYIQGRTLQSLFEQNGQQFELRQVIHYAQQICELLQYLHSRQPQPIIYRDLKPSNVMVGDEDQVRLIDFGIARSFKAEQGSDTVQIGTIGFAAPEQLIGVQTDPRSDLYSLGAMMYYLLTGGQYYYVTGKPIHQLRGDLPHSFTRLMDQLLTERPEERFQAAEQVKTALAHVMETSPEKNKLLSFEPAVPRTIPNKLVVIGSLYSGAGSTFTAMSIARALNSCGVPHALVEHPVIEPDLYFLLFGERKAPQPYVFMADRIVNGLQGGPEWTDGHTLWVPANPDKPVESWNPAHAFEMLHAVKRPLILWDISRQWNEPSAKQLCKKADEIIVVADPSPAKMFRSSVKAVLERLAALEEEGASVRWVANRDTSAAVRKDWLRTFPKHPICTLPEISGGEVMNALWKGNCVQDADPVKEKLLDALQPLLRLLLPNAVVSRQRHRNAISKLLKKW